ncbi:MAG: hypothetical protein LW698_05140 [Planctomycetaceae bacterium]|nr:hypothetical protein [Planctomycetaceae bacterium]
MPRRSFLPAVARIRLFFWDRIRWDFGGAGVLRGGDRLSAGPAIGPRFDACQATGARFVCRSTA